MPMVLVWAIRLPDLVQTASVGEAPGVSSITTLSFWPGNSSITGLGGSGANLHGPDGVAVWHFCEAAVLLGQRERDFQAEAIVGIAGALVFIDGRCDIDGGKQNGFWLGIGMPGDVVGE